MHQVSSYRMCYVICYNVPRPFLQCGTPVPTMCHASSYNVTASSYNVPRQFLHCATPVPTMCHASSYNLPRLFLKCATPAPTMCHASSYNVPRQFLQFAPSTAKKCHKKRFFIFIYILYLEIYYDNLLRKLHFFSGLTCIL